MADACETRVVDGGPLRDNFALFARLPEGSVVSACNPVGCDVTAAPIVVFGSEGQDELLAGSLEGLLAKIALQRFEEEGEWTDFTPHQDVEDTTDQLADWLCQASSAGERSNRSPNCAKAAKLSRSVPENRALDRKQSRHPFRG